MAEEIRVEVEGGKQEPKKQGGCLRKLLLLPGLFFVGLGILIFAVPEALEYMVAGVFILIGLGLLFGSTRIRRNSKGSGPTFFFDGRFERD